MKYRITILIYENDRQVDFEKTIEWPYLVSIDDVIHFGGCGHKVTKISHMIEKNFAWVDLKEWDLRVCSEGAFDQVCNSLRDSGFEPNDDFFIMPKLA